MVKKKLSVSAIEWAAASAAALFYGKTAGLLAVTAVFVYTIMKGGEGKQTALKTVFFVLGIGAGLCGSLRMIQDSVPVRTLVHLRDITRIEGVISGSPVPASKGKYYSVPLRVLRVWCGAGENRSSFSAGGTAVVLLPAEDAERYLPGRLFTAVSDKYGFELPVRGAAVPEQGLSASFSVRHVDTAGGGLFVASDWSAGSWVSRGARLRAAGRLAYKRLLWNGKDSGGLFLALTSGSREYIEPALASGFTDAGLAHVLALSGMHLSLVAGCTGAVLSRLLGKRLGIFCSTAAVLFFFWFAGPSPSLIRSLLFFLAASAGTLAGVRPGALTLTACGFIWQLCADPASAVSVSFLLSYAAVAGIIRGTGLFAGAARGKIPAFLLSAVSVSAAAWTAAFPFCAGFFGTVALAGIPASVCVSPLVTAFMGCAAVDTVCTAAGMPFGFTSGAVYELLRETVLSFARVPPLHIGGTLGTITVIAVLFLFYWGLHGVVERKERENAACFAGL